MMANHLNKRRSGSDRRVTIVAQHATHYYKPGFLFVPFGTYSPEQVMKPKAGFVPKGVEFIQQNVEVIETDKIR